MSILEALLLGIVQGLSEFLPISSTAHVTLAGKMLGLVDPAEPQAWTAFLAVVQLGTLVAVLAYFRGDIARMSVALWRAALARGRVRLLGAEDARDARLALLIVLGTVPIAVVGLALRDVIEGAFTKDLRVIAASLVGLALLLALAERVGARKRGIAEVGARDALLVGVAQVFALVPGASRSGTTLTGGLLAGLKREDAARFSFLLSIPAIAASGLFELPVVLDARGLPVVAVVVATLAAAASGYAAIAWLLRFLQRSSTMVFVGYRIVLGATIATLLWTGVVAPL